MAISKDEIIHIAKLSDLNLSEEEIERYKTDLNDILEFATIINNVDTSDVDITIGANAKSNCFRKDEVVNFPNTDLLLKNVGYVPDYSGRQHAIWGIERKGVPIAFLECDEHRRISDLVRAAVALTTSYW